MEWLVERGWSKGEIVVYFVLVQGTVGCDVGHYGHVMW